MKLYPFFGILGSLLILVSGIPNYSSSNNYGNGPKWVHNDYEGSKADYESARQPRPGHEVPRASYGGSSLGFQDPKSSYDTVRVPRESYEAPKHLYNGPPQGYNSTNESYKNTNRSYSNVSKPTYGEYAGSRECNCVRWTNWISADTPSDSGDFETLGPPDAKGKVGTIHHVRPDVCTFPLRMECRTLHDATPWYLAYEHVTEKCTPHGKGFSCENKKQVHGKCKDYEIRLLCFYSNGYDCPCLYWTDWYDTYDPIGKGDEELIGKQLPKYVCEHGFQPVDVQCETVLGLDVYHAGNKNVKCDLEGLSCYNEDQGRNCKCHDYRVRFLCPKFPSNYPIPEYDFNTNKTYGSGDYGSGEYDGGVQYEKEKYLSGNDYKDKEGYESKEGYKKPFEERPHYEQRPYLSSPNEGFGGRGQYKQPPPVRPPPQYEEPPRQYEKPPHQYEEPPRQYEESPRRYEESPRRYEEPPRQYEEPPRQYEELPRRYEESPRQYEESPRRYEEPPRQYEEPPRQYEEPQRRYEKPPPQYQEPPPRNEQPPVKSQPQYEQPLPDYPPKPSGQYDQPEDDYTGSKAIEKPHPSNVSGDYATGSKDSEYDAKKDEEYNGNYGLDADRYTTPSSGYEDESYENNKESDDYDNTELTDDNGSYEEPHVEVDPYIEENEDQKPDETPEEVYKVPEKENEHSGNEYEAPVNEYEAPVKEYEAPVKEYEAPGKEYEGPVKEYEGPVKEYEGPVKEYEGPVKEYEGPVKEYEGPVKEYEGTEKPYNGLEKPYDIPEKPYEGSKKLYEGPEKPYEGPDKSYESSEKSYEGSERPYDIPRKPYEEPQRPERPYGGHDNRPYPPGGSYENERPYEESRSEIPSRPNYNDRGPYDETQPYQKPQSYGGQYNGSAYQNESYGHSAYDGGRHPIENDDLGSRGSYNEQYKPAQTYDRPSYGESRVSGDYAKAGNERHDNQGRGYNNENEGQYTGGQKRRYPNRAYVKPKKTVVAAIISKSTFREGHNASAVNFKTDLLNKSRPYDGAHYGHGEPHYGRGEPDYGHGAPDYEHGKPGYGHGKSDYGHGEPKYGHSEPGYGHAKPEYGRGEPNYGRGEPNYGRGKPNYGRGEPNYEHSEPGYGQSEPSYQPRTYEGPYQN